MPLPGWLARFNRRGTNRITRRFAGWVPGFAVIIHKGRRSGRTYRTPVNIFRSGDGYVIALTYGSDRDWVKNVLAAGGCDIEYRGRTIRLTDPRLVTDQRQRPAPAVIRPFLAGMGVTEFMELKLQRERGNV
jgi:deazaflavin-dependent oxidoreductase (nitroreductase family)